MKAKDAAILAAGLGGWTVAAVSSETVVLGIPCQHHWVCMVHCRGAPEHVSISILYGHPQQGIHHGISAKVPSSETFATDLWARINANVSGNIQAPGCVVQYRPVLYGQTFLQLLKLAASYAFWPRTIQIMRSKAGIWRVSDGLATVFVADNRGDIVVNERKIGPYTAKHWLGTEPQDAIFFEICKALNHERSASTSDTAAQAAFQVGTTGYAQR